MENLLIVHHSWEHQCPLDNKLIVSVYKFSKFSPSGLAEE
jgi:hypothetical protein